MLLVLPWILVAAFKLSGPASAGNGTPGLVTVATAGGLNFAAFSLFVSAGFLLVVVVALFCGDTVASEASWSSLRYLLAAPVPRARLLRQKLAVALAYATIGVVTLPVMSLVAGTAAFGWHPLRLPGTGVQLPPGQAVARMLIVLGYVLITEVAVAGIAFLLSVSTDSPLGAVGGAVGLMILSAILDQVTALGSWREILPSHWQFAWLDARAAADLLGRHAGGRRGVRVLRDRAPRAGLPAFPAQGHRVLTETGQHPGRERKILVRIVPVSCVLADLSAQSARPSYGENRPPRGRLVCRAGSWVTRSRITWAGTSRGSTCRWC